MCLCTWIHTQTTLTPLSATWPQTGFPFTGSLHFKMEKAQETKQVANQTPVQFGHTVCCIFLAQVTNCTEWLTTYFPFFFWCSSLQAKQTWEGQKWVLQYPSEDRTFQGLSQVPVQYLTQAGWQARRIEVHRLSQGWESAWNHREVVGQGSWLRHGHRWVQLVSEGRGWRGRRVTLHITDFLDHIQLQHGTKGLSIDNL